MFLTCMMEVLDQLFFSAGLMLTSYKKRSWIVHKVHHFSLTLTKTQNYRRD